MSIHVEDAAGGEPDRASGLVEDARERVTNVAAVPTSALDDAELKRLLTVLTGLEAQAASLRNELLAESERRGGRWPSGRGWPIPRRGRPG